MFHMEQLNVLREHNKDLLKQLKQENEAYEHRNDCNNGRVEKAEFQVLTDRSSAQASLAESNVPSAGNFTCLIYIQGYSNDDVTCHAFRRVNRYVITLNPFVF